MELREMAARTLAASAATARWLGRLVRGQVVEMTGGPARARVVVIFGAVLALSSADAATVGAAAPQLEQALKISNAEVGLLSSVALLIGAVFTLPVGLAVDRVRRMPVLAGSIVLWSVASLAGALSGSYTSLLLSRLALGAEAATAGPAIASLTGDYFPARERGQIYSYILGGEIAGTAVGFIASSALASLISWRVPFALLAIPGLFLARSIWRTVPEPQRGGQSRLRPGALDFDDAAGTSRDEDWLDGNGEAPTEEADLAHETMRRRGVEPDPTMVLRQSPGRMGIAHAVRYILSIPSNMLLIISSALGYFYFAGLQTFVVIFVRGHYKVGEATVELVFAVLVVAGLAGTMLSGRITDTMLRRGFMQARVLVPAFCYLGAVVLLIPGILGGKLTPALWFDAGGAGLLLAANPPLDAARLDLMPSGLWGRAESTRTVLRSLAQALAPVMFGGLADLIAGVSPEKAPVGTHSGPVSAATATGMEITFLIMLIPLIAAGVFLLAARHRYPTDVATAAASQEATRADGARERVR